MAIKVFNLSCESDHVFEGWFADAEAFEQQSNRKLISCPVCGSTTVHKMLSAPRLNLGAGSSRNERRAAGELPEGQARGAHGEGDAGEARGGGHRAERGDRGERYDQGEGRDGRGDHGGRDDHGAGNARGGRGDERHAIDPAQMQRLFLTVARKLIEASEDVGDRFVDEARKIYYEQAPVRAIRGSATREEAAELADEGIDVFALPVPESLKGPLQ